MYVDTDDDVRLARRIQRDVAERGRDVAVGFLWLPVCVLWGLAAKDLYHADPYHTSRVYGSAVAWLGACLDRLALLRACQGRASSSGRPA